MQFIGEIEMTASKNKYLFKNTLIFALGNFGTKFISFLLVPIYTNILATNEYGIIDLMQTLAMVLVPILTCNICEAVMRFSLDKGVDHKKILNVGIFSLLVATIVGLSVFVLSFGKSLISEYVVYLYLYILTLAYSQMFMCYLRGRELLLQYAIGNIFQSLCIACFNILLLVILKRGIRGYFEAYILAYVFTTIYALIAGKIYKELGKISVDKSLGKEMFRYSIVLVPNSFMWWIINSSDRIMLTMMVGASVNGLFSIAYKIPTLLSTVTSVFNQAWSYSAIREQGAKDEEEYNNAVYQRLVSVVMICASLLMFILKPFMQVYVGDEYFEAWRYMPVLIMGFVFSTLGTFFSTSYTVHKDSMGFLKSGMAGAFVNVLLNVMLIPVWGAMGAAIATLISYFTVFSYRAKDIRKYVKYNVMKRKYLIGYSILFLQMITLYLETVSGTFLLTLETVVVCIVFRDFLSEMLTMMKKFSNRIFTKK